ncbi:MAG: PAS domain-containing protein [Bacteriovoracaceae bacterium]|nr:PAS domain-containing protein [Bacteriovoracaceae bacterium]
MKKPIPRLEEVSFGFEELFFSTTDWKGVIEFGNTVFVRISGYPAETIIKAPHNIIRHPDMPKCVFKVFWDFLKNNNPIGAYVKNMSADGRYYWVFAFAFPVKDGYLSIRFKPSSEIFSVVQEVYAEVLKKEKASSVEEAEKLLLKLIQDKGFENYSNFMIHAAVTELKSRKKHLSQSHSSAGATDPSLNRITEITNLTSIHLDQSFAKIAIFEEGSKSFRENLALLSSEFQKLKFLSVNMNILAVNFGESAATLSVISEEFSKLATQIEDQIKSFASFTESLAVVIKNCSLNIASLKTQMIMVDFFVKESIHNLKTSANAFDGMIQNKDMFTSLFTASIDQLGNELSKLTSEMMMIEEQMSGIKKLVRTLEIIKQTGAIESSRKDEIKSSFSVYLQEMDGFLNLLRRSINELAQQQTNLSQNTAEIQDSARKIKGNIDTIFDLALKRSH